MIDIAPKPAEPAETYLGDGVYASFDGYQIWLRAQDGVGNDNRIALEAAVYNALLDYAERQMARAPDA